MAKPNDTKATTDQQMRMEIEQLKLQIASLTQLVGIPNAIAPRYPMWSLIRDYLRSNGGSGSPISIAEGLLKAGHKLGKYPLRNVKITVTSPMMHGIFKVTKDATDQETVTLIDRTVRYSPKKWVDKKPARPARR